MIYKKSKKFGSHYLAVTGFIFGLVFCLSAVIFGQTETMAQTEGKQTEVQNEKPVTLQPVFTEYKGITIGMPSDEVRRQIDKKPKIEDKDGFYYVFSDDEAMQIVLDENKKVKVISIIYSGEKSNAPTYEAVFGQSGPLEKNPDGRIYKLIRYPQSGFWIAYSKGAGENPTVTVTIQKM